jgi:hypothetical protein
MHNHYLLALLFALLWSWSLTTANTLGGFVHVPLVAAFICASLGRFRYRRAARG